MLRLLVNLLIQIVQNQMGGGTGVQATCEKKTLGPLQVTKLFRGKKEKIPWGRLRVYNIQQMQGQSKAEDIVVRRKTLHSTNKVMRLNGESFSMSGSFQHDCCGLRKR